MNHFIFWIWRLLSFHGIQNIHFLHTSASLWDAEGDKYIVSLLIHEYCGFWFIWCVFCILHSRTLYVLSQEWCSWASSNVTVVMAYRRSAHTHTLTHSCQHRGSASATRNLISTHSCPNTTERERERGRKREKAGNPLGVWGRLVLPTVKGAFFPLLSPSSPTLSFSFSSYSLSLSLFLLWHLFPLPANTTVCCAELGQSLGHLGPGSGWGVQRHMIIAACVCEHACVCWIRV